MATSDVMATAPSDTVSLPPGTTFRVLADGRIHVIPPPVVALPIEGYIPPNQPTNLTQPNVNPQASLPPSSSAQYAVDPSMMKPMSGQYGSYGYPVQQPLSSRDGRSRYDEEAATYTVAHSLGIPGRLDFVRRVYGILTIQLLVTLGFILLFVLNDDVRYYVQRNPGLLYSAIIVSLVVVIALACFRSIAESFPLNVALLALFTFCEGYLLGTVSSFYDTSIVLQAIAITTAITGVLTIYAWTTKSDISRWGTFLAVGLMVLIFGFIIRMFLPYSPIMSTIWACFGALLFAAYLVYDTFLLLHILDPSQYIAACLMLYLDIINMFLFILQILGFARRT